MAKYGTFEESCPVLPNDGTRANFVMNSLQQLEADAEIGKKRAAYVDCESVVNLNVLMGPKLINNRDPYGNNIVFQNHPYTIKY